MKARKDHKGRVLRKGETFRKKDKLYMYKYRDPFGKTCYLYSKDLGDLREKEENLKKDQLDGLDVYSMEKATLNYTFDRYMKYRSDLRKTTRSNYLYIYDHFVRKGFGERKIAQIKYSDVVQFYSSLMEDKKICISTLDSVHCVLHPTFDLAVHDEIIRNNPSNGAKKLLSKRYKGTKGIRRALTVEQQEAFLNALDEPEHVRFRPIFTVMLGTGMRAEGIIGIRDEDIDIENLYFDINHAITYVTSEEAGAKKRKSEYVVGPPKSNAGYRKIPMMNSVRNAVLEEKEMQKALGLESRMTIDGYSGFIFLNRFGDIYNDQSLNRALNRICNTYNAKEEIRAKKSRRPPVMLPHITNHILRHTFCARFCEKETNLKVIQTVMGHDDITTTMNIYAEVSEGFKKETFSRLADNFEIFKERGKASIS